MITRLHQRILSILHYQGPKSRQDLAVDLKIRPNTIGKAVLDLLTDGLLEEHPDPVPSRGRPKVLLSLNSTTPCLLAVEIGRTGLECSVTTLQGRVITRETAVCHSGRDAFQMASRFVREAYCDTIVCVGISSMGFVDSYRQETLPASPTGSTEALSFRGLQHIVGQTPVFLGNNMQGVAAMWMLKQPALVREDVLLIELQDGEMGAALLVNGQRIRKRLDSALEIGHQQCKTETGVCVCGQTSCLEMLFSTEYLRTCSIPQTLGDYLAQYRKQDIPQDPITDNLCWGLANTLNLLCPTRCVIRFPTGASSDYIAHFESKLLASLFLPLQSRIRMEWEEISKEKDGSCAVWTALGSLLLDEPASTSL